jgi:hypothetical protein
VTRPYSITLLSIHINVVKRLTRGSSDASWFYPYQPCHFWRQLSGSIELTVLVPNAMEETSKVAKIRAKLRNASKLAWSKRMNVRSKFDSFCRACNEPIATGEEIEWRDLKRSVKDRVFRALRW